MNVVSYPHIEMNADGFPVISGTTTKVVEIVQDHLAHHWNAEEIQRQYPYLSRAQIHAALTYYYDHQREIEQDVERRLRRVAEIKREVSDDTVQEQLRRLGHLP